MSRDNLGVKLPQDMLDEAVEIVRGTDTDAAKKGTPASAVRVCLEMYLAYYPEVFYQPSVRGFTEERPEVLVNITLDEEQARMLDRFMDDWRVRLVESWRNTPRVMRGGKRPRKPEYRGLVVAAIKEGRHTNCFGFKD